MLRVDQPTFSAGEIGPALVARTDTAKYRAALRRARNVIGLVAGGVAKRQGFEYVGQARDSTQPVRLIPFQFDVDQSYALEFSAGTIRFISNAGYVLEPELTITAITQAAPAVVTSPGHPYAVGDEVYINGVTGMAEVNGRVFMVGSVAGDNFTIQGVDSTSYGAFTGCAGGAPYVAPAAPAPAPPGQSSDPTPSPTPDPVTVPPGHGGSSNRAKA